MAAERAEQDRSQAPVEERVRFEVHEQVATITLCRPPVNAMDSQMQDRIGALADQIAADESIKALVINGGQNFSAGADVAEMARTGLSEMGTRSRQMQANFTKVAKLACPVVAAIDGNALGGGLELALCADYRIATNRAVLAQPEVLLGIMPGLGGTQRLPRLIGPSAAKQMIFTGQRVDADQAQRLGLVNEVVEPDALLDAANTWARQFVGAASWALRWAKEAIDTGLETDISSGLMIEATGFAALFGTADRRTGMQSFLEHGPGQASFRGR